MTSFKTINTVYFHLFLILLVAATALPAKAEKILDVQTFVTESGIEVWLVDDTSVPIISMQYSFQGGMAFDPLEKPGLTYLTSSLMDEGAGDLDSQAFQRALADHSIRMSFSAGRDHFTGTLRTLSKNKDKAAEMLTLALTAPRFDEDAIERVKRRTNAVIRNNMSNPSWMAARAYNGLLFDGDSYALPGQGTLDSIALITREDIQNLARDQITKEHLKVSIAGDITRAEAAKFVEQVFKDLPENSTREIPTENAVFRNEGQIFLYEYNNPQTHIIAGHEGIGPTDPDWPAAQLINYVLGGGGFDSRLMQEIREKRGLTYGISTNLVDLKRAPTIQTSLSTSNANVAEAIKLLQDEWKRMALTGPTEQELEHAKAYLTGSLVLSLTSTASIAAVLNGIQKNNFDADYINRRNELLNRVTADEARQVAGRLLRDDRLFIIAVGAPVDFTPDQNLDRIPGLVMTAEQETE